MEKFLLTGTWELFQEQGEVSYKAQVPGTVLSTLVPQGALPDPFYREQEGEVKEFLETHSFVFRRSFSLPGPLFCQEHVDLVFEGLDTLATVEVNGQEVLSASNMHRTYRVSVKKYLTEGENTISVRFIPPQEFIDSYVYEPEREIHAVPTGCWPGNQLVRKAHCSFGWDWGPNLPDMGIWREVRLEAYTGLRLSEVQLHQELSEGEAVLTGVISLAGEEAKEPSAVRLCLYDGSGACVAQDFAPLKEGQRRAEITLHVKEPKLWWPAMYGEPYVYRAVVTLENSKASARERVEKTIGFRTLTVSRERDAYGREFCFVVNGVKIFAMGADWIPEDACIPSVTEERISYLLDSALRANMNCLRVWGGGYYPSDAFYDMCDEKGILIWQDLMFACNVYDARDDFMENCVAEIRDNVRRLRHHPSLALWCGNNELESGWLAWENFVTESPYLKADYIRMFEEVFPKVVKEEDPDTFFWPSSPSSGGCFADPDSENDGDAHYWAVWHGLKPFTDYQNHFFRFCSEFGFQSFPCLRTVEAFTLPQDRNIFSPVMENHQKNPGANGKIISYLAQTFRYPERFDDLLYLTQVLQGMAMRFGVDHFRRNRGRCMGALYWQLNDNWPVASWASLDYYGRWKALHYMAKRFYDPLAISILVEEEVATLYVENETLQEQSFEARLTLRNMYTEVVGSAPASEVTTVPALTSLPVLTLPLAKKKAEEKRGIYVEGKVKFADGKVVRFSEPLVPFKSLELLQPDIHAEVEMDGDAYLIRLVCPVYAPFVELSLDGIDAIFSDNYFDLSDGEGIEVKVERKDLSLEEALTKEEFLEKLRIRSLGDTYLGK